MCFVEQLKVVYFKIPNVKEKFRCCEAQIEESEKASSRRESNPGHLACAASALFAPHNI